MLQSQVLETNMAMVINFYPRIGNALKLFWGEKEFNPYMDKLLNDTRGGTREGFPKTISDALLVISEIHNEVFPKLVPKETDIWAESTFGRML